MNERKKKLLFVTGTRAEYGLAEATILKLAELQSIDFRLLVTGMHTLKNYGLTMKEIEKDTSIDCTVPIKESDDMLTALTREISGIRRYVIKEKIDTIMVAGDRDETFAAAVVGIHLNIPVIHVSGGDVSGPSVDHYLRNAMTIFSKLHLVQTSQAARNVISLGADPINVHVVGSMGLHNLNPRKLPGRQDVARRLGLDARKPWFLATHHPTPFDAVPFNQQIDSVLTALKRLDPNSEKIIIYPNSDNGSDVFISGIEKLRNKSGYHIFKNLNHELFLATIYYSQAMIGNSSAGLFEAGYLKKAFINVGARQLGRERGANVIDADYQPAKILKAVRLSLTPKFQKTLKSQASVYRGGDVAGRIIKHVQRFLAKYRA